MTVAFRHVDPAKKLQILYFVYFGASFGDYYKKGIFELIVIMSHYMFEYQIVIHLAKVDVFHWVR